MKPSYSWRRLHGAMYILKQGIRWVVGDGESLDIWVSRWLPAPINFRPICRSNNVEGRMKVTEIINRDEGCWKEDIV